MGTFSPRDPIQAQPPASPEMGLRTNKNGSKNYVLKKKRKGPKSPIGAREPSDGSDASPDA